MGKISTNELFDRYFESVSDTSIPLSRKTIDRPALYNYERKIGKELIDMDVDELFGLIQAISNTTKDGKEIEFLTSHYSYGQLASLLRAIFNFYIDNIEPIRNPLNDKRMKGTAAIQHLSKGKKKFSWDIVQEVIDDLHRDRDMDNADYVELILRLFYDGFANPAEVISMKREMVDPKSLTVRLPGKLIKISQRTYYLLEHFYYTNDIPGHRDTYLLVSWHGSYFQFIVRKRNADDIDSRDQSLMSNSINRCISVQVNKRYKTRISYIMLYYLGFYDFIVKRYGQERIQQALTSHRNFEDVELLTRAAREYGIDAENATKVKYHMRSFI